MVDPVSTQAAAKAVQGVGEATSTVLARLLGPSADVLGEHWAGALEGRLNNVRRVVHQADLRSQGAGAISLRVADGVLAAAQFAESECVAEYLSGVLASSRSEHSPDDRGVSWTSLIAQLSSDQVRLHYILYAAARHVIELNVAAQTDSAMCKVQCFVDFRDVDRAMDWGEVEGGPRFREALYGLQRQQLIRSTSHGKTSFLAKSHPDADFSGHGGLIYRVRIPGLMLYLWGLGNGDQMATRLLDPEFDLTPVGMDVPDAPQATFFGFAP